MIKFVAVGADGCLDLDGVPWARRATDDEERAYLAGFYGVSKGEAFIDWLGRPYWLWAIDTAHTDIPKAVVEKALRCYKVVRLIDDVAMWREKTRQALVDLAEAQDDEEEDDED